jgi:hypothetical protein
MCAPFQREPKKGRKHLSADPLYKMLRGRFEKLPDGRRESSSIALADALMSGVALFALKDPSLLAFDDRRQDENMKRLFHIERVPCDTQMRTILDPVDPLELRSAFGDVFRELQRGKALEQFKFQGAYLLLMDGTQYFTSDKVHCDSCLKKVHQDGSVSYSHQMLSAVLAHPDFKEVIPFAPEPIGNQDGQTKNDCERNAAARLLQRIHAEHPRLPLIVVEDGLASNAPHIRKLKSLGMHFILGAKPGDHEFLYDRLLDAYDRDRVTVITWRDGDRTCEITSVNQLPLNAANADLLVNFLGYAEYDHDGEIVKQLMGFLLLGSAVYFGRRFLPAILAEDNFWWLLFTVIAAVSALVLSWALPAGARTSATVVNVTAGKSGFSFALSRTSPAKP